MKRQILRWTFFGLLLRLLIMPFSFHGHDIFFIYYSPFKFVEEGVWNPYLFLKESFPEIYNPYFPPVIFLIISGFLFLFRPLLPALHNLFSSFEAWNFTWEGNTIHFSDIFMDHQLFRTLFIFKMPFLIFDFGIGWFLYQILKSDEKKSLLGYKLWMLNPFVLHSCYALGQVDIITTFFILAVVYFIYIKRRYLAMISFSFGILTKIFPIILAPFAILLLGRSFRDRLKLSFAVIIPMIVIIAPFYRSSPNATIEALFFSPTGIPFSRQICFAAGYLGILGILLFTILKRKGQFDFELVILSFILGLLLFYSFYVVTIRYFILITPLLIYIALKNKVFWIYNVIFFITLFELRTAGNTQQWGLFAALHPEFFSSLPISDSYLNLLVSVKNIHQWMYRLFIISSLIMIANILVINRNLFRFQLPVYLKNEKN